MVGRVDDVRLSKVARYTKGHFEPKTSLEKDSDTLVLLRFDLPGAGMNDAARPGIRATVRGKARVVVENR